MKTDHLLVLSTQAYAYMADAVCAAGPFERGAVTRKRFPDGEGYVRIDDAFTVAGQVPVPEGRYSEDGISLRAGTASSRAWRLNGNARFTDFYDGRLRAYTGSLTLTPSPALSFTASANRNDVSLPGGSFVADIFSLRVDRRPREPVIPDRAE